MTRGFANAGKAMLAPFVKLMAIMAPILGAAGMARGVKDVIDYGGAISDMANRLGIAASKIVVIEEVFRRTGAAGKDVATTLQRMGKNIEAGIELPSSEAGKAMEILGITMEMLAGMDLAERFEFIGKKIGEIKDAGVQARVSMALFGREGAALVNTFKTGNAFDVARKSVGQLGTTMDGMADHFDKISDSFGAIGMKLRQMFAGIAQQILPTLDRVSDFIDNVDLTDFGKKLGGAAETLFATFRNGSLGEIIWESFKYAAAKLGEFLGAVLEYSVSKMMAALSKTELGQKLGMGDGGESRTVTLPNGKKVIQANYRTYEDTAANRAMISGKSMSFGDAMRTNEGAFGSTQILDGIKSIATAANTQKQEAWLKEIGWSNKEILAAIKQQSQYMRNAVPSIPR